MIAALVPLTDVEAPPHQELEPGFDIELDRQHVHVTAVLDRTVVVEDQHGERHVINKRRVLVDPTALSWRPIQSLTWAQFHAMRAAAVPGRDAGARGRTASLASRPCCTRCDARLGAANRSGLCGPCLRVCPAYGGPKDGKAVRCMGCVRAGRGQRQDQGSREE